MTQTEIETQYENCVNLLHKTVWEFIYHTGIPTREYDELFSQANLYFMVATQSYNNKDTEFSTWVRIQVWGRLLTELTKNRREWEKRHRPKTTERQTKLLKASLRIYTEPPIEWLDEIGADSKILILMLREGELDLDMLVYRGRVGIRYVFQTLREMGWSRVRIHRCFKDLKRLLA